ncbi:tetratricopeptide repeat protein [Uliginosibacterium sp. 31-16]|uniref:tetratricopeptide repeat protein n=1 Tax=Uliginosibacterium sp. 31-16 TaxID=3068315 RepID=UPI00273E7615|nr:tetratricopeptide repeat protein [Uliginosibacterium sp. 31-16]MDP5241034.1 tetratricopeptide repeat protein [Uliginosibacterium sp. 31-16]
MPFLGIGLHVLVAIYFGIHAIRRGRELYWLFILFMFPLFGSIVYFFVAYLPELRENRGVRKAGRAVVQAIDPGRELREARKAYELTPILNNRLRLAEALLASGDVAAALQHFTEAAQGPFATDVVVLRGLARAQLAANAPQDAAASLERLFADHKEARRHPDAALLYARALAGTNAAGVREAFALALEVGTDAEPKCRYADWLRTQGGAADVQQARELYAQIIKDSGHWHRHAKSHNAEWLRRAQAGVSA